MSEDAELPDHVEEVVRAVAAVHDAHEQRATLLERSAERITALLGSPATIVAIVLLIVGWIALNLLAPMLGVTTPDPELKYIELAGTMAALVIARLDALGKASSLVGAGVTRAAGARLADVLPDVSMIK